MRGVTHTLLICNILVTLGSFEEGKESKPPVLGVHTTFESNKKITTGDIFAVLLCLIETSAAIRSLWRLTLLTPF